MNKGNRNVRYGMVLAGLLLSGQILPGRAQSVNKAEIVAEAKKRTEQLVVFTDRSLYAVNESIRFSAILQTGEAQKPGPGSDVLYAELVNTAGEAVAKDKYPLASKRSSGDLPIPSSIVSGSYYLRCYTRWMRNFGAAGFTYVPVRVVNPYSEERAAEGRQPGKHGLSVIQNNKPAILCTTNKPSYGTGELVDAQFTLTDGSVTGVRNGCITVVPEGSVDTSAVLYKVDRTPEVTEPFQLKYLPDRNGTALSGAVLDSISRVPVPGARIHFTILGGDPAYLVTTSDQEGRFLVKIPDRTGTQEMFVVPEQSPERPLDVLIDNDFSSEPLPFQAEPFSFNETEKQVASKISLQMQLQQNYFAVSEADSSVMASHPIHIPFYGKPEISVQIDEFVNLPNMEEVIVNLVPNTYVMRRGGREYFMIRSENPMIAQYKPLILVDHIPVFDLKVILAIPPTKFERIEVVPEIYVIGEVKYGGIICFTSRKRDLAGMKLPEGSYFFDYPALHSPSPAKQPRFPGGSRIPDTRNTLFWKDHLTLDRERSARISFRAASLPGDYLILFRGVSPEGTVIYGSKRIHVE
jgi:hypothetical protein